MARSIPVPVRYNQSMSTSKLPPVLVEATRRLLEGMVQLVEDNELNKSKSSAWVAVYPHEADASGNFTFPEASIKSDRYVRGLLDYLASSKAIEVVNLIERPYKPDNLRLAEEHEIVTDFEFRVSDFDNLKFLLEVPAATSKMPMYDKNDHLLTVNGRTTKIPGDGQHLLLTMLFSGQKALGEEWASDEVEDYIDPNGSGAYNLEWHRHTGNDLNRKLAKATELGIKDFLISTRTSIRVNPKYLV